jgi:pilus assembly protein CpaF
VVSGGTGTGKTTLLNCLSGLIPFHERIVTIEDSAELCLRHENLVALEARPSNVEGRGQVSIRDLVRNALRMRPDRIVVGECRGGETLDMLQAMNTGHDGSLTTAHANSPRDLLSRLEVMTLMAGMELPLVAVRGQIASAVHLIVQQARYACGARRIVVTSEVTGTESGRIQMQDIFRFEQGSSTPAGTTSGSFVACGNEPAFYERLPREMRPPPLCPEEPC